LRNNNYPTKITQKIGGLHWREREREDERRRRRAAAFLSHLRTNTFVSLLFGSTLTTTTTGTSTFLLKMASVNAARLLEEGRVTNYRLEMFLAMLHVENL
jgi:hypothetical protein